MRAPLQTRGIRAPDGTAWRVSIRWMPWRPRRRLGWSEGFDDLGDAGSCIGGTDDIGGCLFLLVGVAVLSLLAPIIIFGLELISLVLTLVAFVAIATVGLRNWQVEVERAEDGGTWSTPMELHVRGVRAADRAMAEVAERIRVTGQPG